MTQDDLKKTPLPDAPGVYFFHGDDDAVLYVGKATSLASRVRSYFSDDLIDTRGPRIVDMVTRAVRISWEETDSVLEALLREAHYIKKLHPVANTDGKDGKTFNFVVITKESLPRVLMVRGRELEKRFPKTKRTAVYGPFPHGGQLKEALRIIKKIFPFFDTPRPVSETSAAYHRARITFNQQIGLYPHTQNPESMRRYRSSIRHVRLFFEGKKKQMLRELEQTMRRAAKEERFEEAARARKTIEALTHIRDISLLKHEGKMPSERGMRIEGYDIAHFSGHNMVGVMVVYEDGALQPREYRTFAIHTTTDANDTKALAEVIERRVGHEEWSLPHLIVVDGGVAQKRRAETTLRARGIAIPVVSVVKDAHHRPRAILGAYQKQRTHESVILMVNAEAHRFAIATHRKKQRKSILAPSRRRS